MKDDIFSASELASKRSCKDSLPIVDRLRELVVNLLCLLREDWMTESWLDDVLITGTLYEMASDADLLPGGFKSVLEAKLEECLYSWGWPACEGVVCGATASWVRASIAIACSILMWFCLTRDSTLGRESL